LDNIIVHTWPESASTASPQTWAPALFGVAPPATNRPPVAVARAPRVPTITTPQPIALDGTGSFDPDGQPLTYHWTQLAGPPVALSDPASASPSFNWPPGSGPGEFQFRLVVNDGQLDSPNADIDFPIYAVALNPQPLPPARVDPISGAVSGALTWPGTTGDRAVIEASQDLKQWTPIATNSVDFDGRLHFRDPEANQYRYRFYRAHGPVPGELPAQRADLKPTPAPLGFRSSSFKTAEDRTGIRITQGLAAQPGSDPASSRREYPSAAHPSQSPPERSFLYASSATSRDMPRLTTGCG